MRAALALNTAAPVLLAAMLAAGCGGGGESGGGGSTGPAEIVVGHYGSMTGSEATFGHSTSNGINLAINEFKASIDGAASADPTSMVRLASAYNGGGKYNEAGMMADKVIAMAGVSEAIKKVAQAEKQRAEKGKTSK